MRKKILKSKMMMIALASILFVSCGGGGNGREAVGRVSQDTQKTGPVTMFVSWTTGALASQTRHDCCPQSSMIRG